MKEGDKTAVVEARVDMRDLATCVKYLIDNGVRLNSRSDAIWRVFRTMAETIEKQGDFVFDRTETALEFLTTLQMGSWNRMGRTGKPMGGVKLTQAVMSERVTTTDTEPSVADFIDMIKSGEVRMPE